jgi:DNA-binding response OmpR family regulator
MRQPKGSKEREPLHFFPASWVLGGWSPAVARAEREPAGRRPPQGGRLRLLVVEPDARLRADISRRLYLARFDVSAADTGALALRIAEHDGPADIVFVDLALPDIAPRSLVTALRARAGAHVLAAFLSREQVRNGRYEGAPVLGKPFDTNRLLALVDEVLLDRAQDGERPPPRPAGTGVAALGNLPATGM